MSIQQLDLVLKHSQATPAAKLILVGIANHANDAGEAWPSRELLATYGNCSIRSVSRHIGELTDLGELEVFQNEGPGRSDRRPNLYRIIILRQDNQGNGVTDRVERQDNQGRTAGQLWPTKHQEPSINLKRKFQNSVVDDLEAARLDRERRLAEGKRLREWMAAEAAKAVPMPECHHGRKLLQCLECCQALNESEKTA